MEVTAFVPATCASSTKAHPLVIAFLTGRKEWVGKRVGLIKAYLGAFSLHASCLGSHFCFGKRWCLVNVASLKRV